MKVINNPATKKKGKDPKEIVEEIPEPIPFGTQKLNLDPDSLLGVASAYRYKLTVLNPELEKCALYFDDSMDVFAFNDVNKKRALKKQDWPGDAPLNHPRRYNVKVQLLAGNAEIKACGGCSMWKEMTKKPFLVLTPHGTRCVEYSKSPFILLIFRCCPKFHSYTKQFSLRVTITHNNFDIVYATEVLIHRKKMNNPTKKRKSFLNEDEEEDEEFQDEESEQHQPHRKEHKHTHICCSAETDIKKPRLISLLDPANFSPLPRNTNNNVHHPNLPSLSMNPPSFETSNNLESILALHQNLFPQESKLFNGQYDLEDFPLLPPSDLFKPNKPKTALKGYGLQPFQQYQEEYELINAQYEQGQPAPQQWRNIQQFFDFLNSKATKAPPPAAPLVNDLKTQLISQPTSLPISQFSVESPDITNDEKWLSSVLEDIPFSTELFKFDDPPLFPFEI